MSLLQEMETHGLADCEFNRKLLAEEYEVQEHTLCGWENTWTTYDDEGNEVPSTFRTKEDAQAELDDFFYQCEQAVKDGNMEDVPDREDFQIVKVE
jgi:hypothetical protein